MRRFPTHFICLVRPIYFWSSNLKTRWFPDIYRTELFNYFKSLLDALLCWFEGTYSSLRTPINNVFLFLFSLLSVFTHALVRCVHASRKIVYASRNSLFMRRERSRSYRNRKWILKRFAIRGTDRARKDLPVPYMDSSRIHRSILRSILDYDSHTPGATFLTVLPRQPEENNTALPPRRICIFARVYAYYTWYSLVSSGEFVFSWQIHTLTRGSSYVGDTRIWTTRMSTLQTKSSGTRLLTRQNLHYKNDVASRYFIHYRLQILHNPTKDDTG